MGISEQLPGNSSVMNMLNLEIKLVAASDLAALILGEPGTGKGLVAQCIHKGSKRKNQALIAIDCTHFDDDMMDRELFGYEAGAFPGALNTDLGKIELANRGSLFIAEISELSLRIQEKLLQVIKFGELQRLGSNQKHKVNVRLVTSTTRLNLKSEVAAGRFSEDLYHKLTVFPLNVPALRKRDKDVLLLAGNFLVKIQSQMGIQNLVLSNDAETALLAYKWPGNIPQLEQLLRSAALRTADKNGQSDRVVLQRADLNIQTVANNVTVETTLPKPSIVELPQICKPDETSHNAEQNLKQATENFQRQFIKKALQTYNDNSSATARAIGVDRSNLHRLIKRLGIDEN